MAKPFDDTLAIVTATMNPTRAQACLRSWLGQSTYHHQVYAVHTILPGTVEPAAVKEDVGVLLGAFAPGVHIVQRAVGGVVPAFAEGVERAYLDGHRAVLCLHDDVLIEQEGWDTVVLEAILDGVTFGGFGGGTSLGAADIYQTPYNPMQLARGDFASNMRDAEAHGRRTTLPEPMVCFDGFSQLGVGEWFREAWRWLGASGVQHHFYDGMLGCLARRYKREGVLLPIRCHHFGGQTAVADPYYSDWARTQHPDGDQGFWGDAHKIGYEAFRDVLPLRLPGRVR